MIRRVRLAGSSSSRATGTYGLDGLRSMARMTWVAPSPAPITTTRPAVLAGRPQPLVVQRPDAVAHGRGQHQGDQAGPDDGRARHQPAEDRVQDEDHRDGHRRGPGECRDLLETSVRPPAGVEAETASRRRCARCRPPRPAPAGRRCGRRRSGRRGAAAWRSAGPGPARRRPTRRGRPGRGGRPGTMGPASHPGTTHPRTPRVKHAVPAWIPPCTDARKMFRIAFKSLRIRACQRTLGGHSSNCHDRREDSSRSSESRRQLDFRVKPAHETRSRSP